MTASVEVDTSDLEHAMRRLTSSLDSISSRAALDTASEVGDRTRSSVPHRTGELAGSITAERVGDGARVSMGAPYAAWIEYGGSRGRPRVSEGRYLGPASRDADKAMAHRAEVLTESEARRL